MTNPLKTLQEYGQSVWLDFVSRDLLRSGDLTRMIADDGLRGVTSNPSIFEKAIGHGDDYDQLIAELEAKGDLDPGALFEDLAIHDIREGADALRLVYDQTQKHDGYISIEVSPYLAMKTGETIEEGRRLWRNVGRPNLMVKVPATRPGLPAIRALIGDGINVNITLLFSQQVYAEVADAYISGLEDYVAKGGDPNHVASVASFFVSRIDTLVDEAIDKRIAAAGGPAEKQALAALKGKVAIANAKLAYRLYQQIFTNERWQRLAQQGAQTQRLLWASTGTKNKDYSDVLYVEELIGAPTVNTMPPATMDAFRDHGKARNSIEENVAGAEATLKGLADAGVSLDEITAKLVADGVRLFADAADQLYASVQKKRRAVLGSKLNPMSCKLPKDLDDAVKAALEDWRKEGKVRRLWDSDATLWANTDEAKWTGWLTVVDEQIKAKSHLDAFAADVKAAGFTDVLLLGMGGSSLGPEVLALSFGNKPGFPKLQVVDSTDPAQIKRLEKSVNLKTTLFFVSSKSGSTLEPNIFKQYFFDRVKAELGEAEAAKHFVAITDPGSQVEKLARGEGFRGVYHGVPTIGGRYSVLSDFGMIPAAALGIDTGDFLERTAEMARSCAASAPPVENPGVILGAIMGAGARMGRDKLTIISSPGIASLGAWLEQLLAESTGKLGRGIVPVDAEPIGVPAVYGNDRVFAYLRLASEQDSEHETAVAALEAAGQPVVRITVSDAMQIGQEFYRWEMATAVAGSIIGINPFDQPDVEAQKIKTRELTSAYEKSGKLPAEAPFFSENGISLFANDRNAAALKGGTSLVGVLKALFGQVKAGDYVALLAYIERNAADTEALQRMRRMIRDQTHAATCLGFGPRFLHSTGQAYKGGPNSGVVLQITCDDAADLAVPGQSYTFGIVKAAQARGDFDVLGERGRRLLRIHLPADLEAGLKALGHAIEQALQH
ncbi:MAG TPA: bifunctional transaldolase/phosoglucose isomerase [Stellaceae bacterium]|jgi:transaldolase/glucose-6-phosphate isomerase|nr:bifunctional transaldolase/phosoglucose isomerase [Stellaceae bacterium]